MSRIHCKELQDRIENKEAKCPGGYRNRYRRRRQKEGFWRRSQVGMVQGIYVTKTHNQYVVPHWWNNKEGELNMQVKVKTKNGKELWVEALMDFRCTYTGIDQQLVKDKRIQTKLVDFSFEIFNADETKNKEVTRMTPLWIEINRHKEWIDIAVTDLNRTDIFLGHN